MLQPPFLLLCALTHPIIGWRDPKDVPEASLDASVSVGNGYGESKWVAENILDVAHKKTPLRPVIVRVGQLCGSTLNGSWNPWEWFPAIVQSYKILGCLPGGVGVSQFISLVINVSLIMNALAHFLGAD